MLLLLLPIQVRAHPPLSFTILETGTSLFRMKFLISVDYPQPSFLDPDSNFFLPGLTSPKPQPESSPYSMSPRYFSRMTFLVVSMV